MTTGLHLRPIHPRFIYVTLSMERDNASSNVHRDLLVTVAMTSGLPPRLKLKAQILVDGERSSVFGCSPLTI